MRRDIEAFVRNDWSGTAPDFLEEGFLILDAGRSPNPAEWRITFPHLAAYRDEWVRQAAEFLRVELEGESKLDFLLRVANLDRIEVHGEVALAHKRFMGVGRRTDGGELRLQWQSLFWLRKCGGAWKIAGALGYLPHPLPAEG